MSATLTTRGEARDHPVELRPLRAADADRHHDVGGVGDAAEGERRHDALAGVELGLRQQPHEPRREQPQAEREPGRDDDEIREHERVRALGLAVVLDRVGERRPGHPERGQQEHHRRGDPDADLVQADVREAREVDEEEAVAEVDGDQRERGRDERHAEAVHLAQQRPRELEPELLPVDGEQREIDDQRADEVADDHAERALLPDDDEQDRGADRDGDVGEAREHERGRALLGAEERGQLLVVHLRPDADEAGADEVRVVEPEQVGERVGEQDAGDEPERRARHREPERRADDEPPLRRRRSSRSRSGRTPTRSRPGGS